jgi:hypothetical protein
VTSAAVEAARSVAGFASAQAYGGPSPPGAASSEQAAVAIAESRARAALGRYGKVTTFAWRFLPTDGTPTAVELNVRFDASASGFDLTRPLALPGLNRFDRTVRVRVEHITCPATAPCRVVSGSGTGSSP